MHSTMLSELKVSKLLLISFLSSKFTILFQFFKNTKDISNHCVKDMGKYFLLNMSLSVGSLNFCLKKTILMQKESSQSDHPVQRKGPKCA